MAVESELEIDEFLTSVGNDLEYASRELQEFGVDRIIISEVGGLPYHISLQYEVDYRAHETGNLFLLTQRRDRYGKISPGWLRTSIAQTILFYVPFARRMLFIDVNELKEWVFVYGRQLKNVDWIEKRYGWAIRGICLPIAVGRANLRSWIEMDTERGEACR